MAAMRRHVIVACVALCAAAMLVFAAWAPAAGDSRITGASHQKLTFNADGVPVASGGPECRAGKAHKMRTADARDY